MKKILLGIALILFGLNITYVSAVAGWAGIDVAGLVCSIAGIIFSVIGYAQKEDQ